MGPMGPMVEGGRNGRWADKRMDGCRAGWVGAGDSWADSRRMAARADGQLTDRRTARRRAEWPVALTDRWL